MVKVVGHAPARVICGGMLLFVLGGLLAALMLHGTGTGAQHLQLRTERAALLQERSELEAERAQTVSPLHQTQRALLTERAARLELEKILATVQLELGRTQDQLAFFEDLLPPSPHGALDIRAVDIEQHAEGLQYRVLLMRNGKATKHFVGTLQFVAIGHCRGDVNGPEQMVILQPLLAEPLPVGSEGFVAQSVHGKSQQAEPPRVNTQQQMRQQVEAQQTEAQRAALRLDFAQFQRGQGFLALPPRFAPKSVTVRVLDGDIVLASRVVAL
ncbi:MAG: hypothetical protein K9J49_03650 [Candidatus Methylopumilus sp.]|nr:hypothetical protein [Candidatus Methylopumilus sp.]